MFAPNKGRATSAAAAPMAVVKLMTTFRNLKNVDINYFLGQTRVSIFCFFVWHKLIVEYMFIKKAIDQKLWMNMGVLIIKDAKVAQQMC